MGNLILRVVISPDIQRRSIAEGERKGEKAMKIKSNLKAGGRNINHNQTIVRDKAKAGGVKVKTNVRAGGVSRNHNQTLVRDER